MDQGWKPIWAGLFALALAASASTGAVARGGRDVAFPPSKCDEVESAKSEIAATAAGAAALAQFDSGDENGALDALDRARVGRKGPASTAQARRIAILAERALWDGAIDEPALIARFETLTRQDGGAPLDWALLASLYLEYGRVPEARAAAETAVRTARLDRDRAVALTALGLVDDRRGDPVAAAGALQEELALRRRLALAGPGDVGCQRRLIHDLDIYSRFMESKAQGEAGASPPPAAAQRDWKDSNAAMMEGLQLAQRVAAANPDNVDALRELPAALGSVIQRRQAEVDRAHALAAINTQVWLLRQMGADHPENAWLRLDLADALWSFSPILTGQSIPGANEAAAEQSLGIRHELGVEQPGNAAVKSAIVRYWLRHMAVEFFSPKQKQTDASEGLAIARDVAAARPLDADMQYRVVSLLWARGGSLDQLGDPVGARSDYEEAVAILRRLAAHDPFDTRASMALSDALAKLSEVLAETGDTPAAARIDQEYLSIVRPLLAAEPTGPEHPPAVSALLDLKFGGPWPGQVSWGDVLWEYELLERAGLTEPGDLTLESKAEKSVVAGLGGTGFWLRGSLSPQGALLASADDVAKADGHDIAILRRLASGVSPDGSGQSQLVIYLRRMSENQPAPTYAYAFPNYAFTLVNQMDMLDRAGLLTAADRPFLATAHRQVDAVVAANRAKAAPGPKPPS